MRALILALALTLAALAPARAGDTAALIADSLDIRAGSVLLASGHVEVFYKGAHLTAAAITYDQKADRLQITGPIWLVGPDGTLIAAEMADLKADLTEGILTSARLVLADRLQMAASDLQRSDGGRYTALRNVAASSCTICKGSTTPLWEIRAASVVHDTVEHQIWFTGAELRFWGLPIAYLPELRVPDPDLKRAAGFLLPSIRTSTRLGTGLKLPYFLPLGPSRDLLLTPYLTTVGDQTLGLRYRQAFTGGLVTLQGALSTGTATTPDLRGYLQADGSFNLPRDYNLSFHLIGASDRAYLLDYGISDDDRLASDISVTRTRRNSWTSASVTGIQSLRAGEGDGTFPSVITDLSFHRRFEPAILGGTAGFELQTHTTHRDSTNGLDLNGDGTADGRDLGRVSARADWRRNWLLSPGIEVSAIGLFTADDYQIAQDVIYEGNRPHAAATAGVELRWPWTRNGAAVTQTIEPVLQLVVSPQTGAKVPNEDSTLVEFDEGNLFTFDRFPGADAVEGGLRANLGVNYLADFAGGLSFGTTLGRVFRVDAPSGFPGASGLDQGVSDWMLAASLRNDDGLGLTGRLVLDDSLALTKGEVRLDLSRPKYDLSTGYTFVQADSQEDRPDRISELSVDGGYQITDGWTARATGRYNVAATQLAAAGVELSFVNECLSAHLSLSRRFTHSTTVQASTDFGLSVELLGFGGSSHSGAGRQCQQ